MLSHHNILSNVKAVTQAASEKGRYLTEQDLFLSFLPLSHMLERTAGYYVPMLVGATVAYARSIPQLSMDLIALSPTVLISVPRIYEQVHDKIQSQLAKKAWFARQLFNLTLWVGRRHFEYTQGRVKWLPIEILWPPLHTLVAEPLLKKLGGRIRLAICGGAALPPPVAKLFTGVGLTLLQGYGLTESSPVITVNRPLDNIPASIGIPLPGIEVKPGDNGELLTKSDCVMLGYWKNPVATQNVIDAEGWLHTGDKACQDTCGHWYITGRIKDIIVMGNGEKIPPSDMEMMIATDTLFEQVMVLGEGKPFLSALVVLNLEQWQQFAKTLQVDATEPASLQIKLVQKAMLTRIRKYVRTFPGYAQIRRVTLLQEPWTIENGLLTPTLKIKRARILERYATQIEQMYKGF
jgi:long-chain acyl-CoA synthetase